MVSFFMIGKVNERLPITQRISYLWWGSEVRTRFKQLYPSSRLIWLHDSCAVLLIRSGDAASSFLVETDSAVLISDLGIKGVFFERLV
jgi:hypothetical protein